MIDSAISKSTITNDSCALVGFIAIEESYEKTVDSLTCIMTSIDLPCAISDVIDSPFQCYASFHDAMEVFDSVKGDAADAVIEFRKHSNDLVFQDPYVQKHLWSHRDRHIDTLIAYDNAHGTSYCSDLYHYLFNFSNITMAAKSMFIHRNTLAYRIEQIASIMDADLKDPRTCNALLLDLETMRAMESTTDAEFADMGMAKAGTGSRTSTRTSTSTSARTSTKERRGPSTPEPALRPSSD